MRRKIRGMKFTDASHNRHRLFVGILGILIVDPFHPAILSWTFLFVTSKVTVVKVLVRIGKMHQSAKCTKTLPS